LKLVYVKYDIVDMWNSILLIKYLNNNWRIKNAIRPKMNNYFFFTFTFRTFYLDTISSPDNIILINSHCQTNARSTCCFSLKSNAVRLLEFTEMKKVTYFFIHSMNQFIYSMNWFYELKSNRYRREQGRVIWSTHYIMPPY